MEDSRRITYSVVRAYFLDEALMRLALVTMAVALAFVLSLASFSVFAQGSNNDAEKPKISSSGEAAEARLSNEDVFKKFSVNMLDLAKSGAFGVISGRGVDIQKIIHILERPEGKNSVVILGEAGDGKTAVVEGLANKMAQEGLLAGRELLRINLDSLVSQEGTEYKNVLEREIKQFIAAASAESGGQSKYILFIDEFHRIMEIPELYEALKEPIERGLITVIGSTTRDEYSKVEKDPAMSRRFEPYYLKALKIAEALSVMRTSYLPQWQEKYGIRVLESSLQKAKVIVERYFGEKSSIDVLKSAFMTAISKKLSTGASMESIAANEEVLRLNEELKSIKAEIDLLGIENVDQNLLEQKESVEERLKLLNSNVVAAVGPGSEQLQDNQRRLGEVEQRIGVLTAHLDSKQGISEAQEVELTRLHEERLELRSAQESLQAIAQEEANKVAQESDKIDKLKKVITPGDIVQVLADKANLNLSELERSATEKIVNFKEQMSKYILGQDYAVNILIDSLKVYYAGLRFEKSPASFIFAGASGVGKTETAKLLALIEFGSMDAMTRFDMGEFKDPLDVGRLLGSSAGIIRSDEPGRLTEEIRKNPRQVILLDEVDKAHSSVFDALMSALDEGKVVDNQGRTVDFSNVIIVMTTNKGKEYLKFKRGSVERRNFEKENGFDPKELDKLDAKAREQAVLRKLIIDTGMFKEEFLGRIEHIVPFNPISYEIAKKIIQLQIRIEIEKIKFHKGITVQVHPSVYEAIVHNKFNPAFGARELRRGYTEYIRSVIADLIIEKGLTKGEVVKVIYKKYGPNDNRGRMYVRVVNDAAKRSSFRTITIGVSDALVKKGHSTGDMSRTREALPSNSELVREAVNKAKRR